MDSLPNDVILEIFDFLDRDSIVIAIKTSKKWKSLITNSTTLMRKIDLLIRPGNISTVFKEEIDIPHRNLMVQMQPIRTRDEIIQFHKGVTSLLHTFKESAEFIEMVYIEPRLALLSVAALKNLTHLNLVQSASSLPTVGYDYRYNISLPHLKCLGLKGSTALMRYVKDHHIETLKIIDTHKPETNKLVNDFLLTCDTLREIKFMGFIPELSDAESYKFRLTSLSVLLKGQEETCPLSLLAFIKIQKDSLKDLKLIGFTTKNFIEFAISHMRLNKFEVDMSRLREHLADMKPNRTIKTLLLQTIALTMPQLLKILGACGYVEDLKIISNSNLMFSNWVMKASQSMERLKTLYIDSLLGILLPQDLNFKSLETITVTKLGGDAQLLGWVQLISRCPTVKKIAVCAWGHEFMQPIIPTLETPEPTYLRKNNLQFLLISLPELEEIDIQGTFPLTDEVVDVLLANGNKVRKFTFGSIMTETVKAKVTRLHEKIQCLVVKPYEKKNLKRKRTEV